MITLYFRHRWDLHELRLGKPRACPPQNRWGTHSFLDQGYLELVLGKSVSKIC